LKKSKPEFSVNLHSSLVLTQKRGVRDPSKAEKEMSPAGFTPRRFYALPVLWLASYTTHQLATQESCAGQAAGLTKASRTYRRYIAIE